MIKNGAVMEGGREGGLIKMSGWMRLLMDWTDGCFSFIHSIHSSIHSRRVGVMEEELINEQMDDVI